MSLIVVTIKVRVDSLKVHSQPLSESSNVTRHLSLFSQNYTT